MANFLSGLFGGVGAEVVSLLGGPTGPECSPLYMVLFFSLVGLILLFFMLKYLIKYAIKRLKKT